MSPRIYQQDWCTKGASKSSRRRMDFKKSLFPLLAAWPRCLSWEARIRKWCYWCCFPGHTAFALVDDKRTYVHDLPLSNSEWNIHCWTSAITTIGKNKCSQHMPAKAENGNTFSTALQTFQPCIHFWKIGVSSTQSVDLNLSFFWSAVRHVPVEMSKPNCDVRNTPNIGITFPA